MRQRCRGMSTNHFYTDKGVKVCIRWDKSFLSFLEDMGPIPSKKHSLDRINGKLGYKPGNVRWATPEEQRANKQEFRSFKIDGQWATQEQMAKHLGIHRRTLCRWIEIGKIAPLRRRKIAK
jgi:DNA-binding XRE family transcriptional regulator